MVKQLTDYEAEATPWPWSESKLLKSLSSNHQCLVMTLDRAIGYCVLLPLGEVVEILNMVVFSEFQRQGFGRLFVDKIKLYAGNQGASKLWLEVRVDNKRARHLYTCAGFVQSGIRKNYYDDQVVTGTRSFKDALLMECELKQPA